MLQLREFTDDDYAGFFADWWRDRGSPPPPLDLLPQLGSVVESCERPLAAGFLYLDAANSGTAQIGWFVTDPTAPAHSGHALRLLMGGLQEVARSLGYRRVWVTVAERMAPFFESLGFVANDRNLVHLAKPL